MFVVVVPPVEAPDSNPAIRVSVFAHLTEIKICVEGWLNVMLTAKVATPLTWSMSMLNTESVGGVIAGTGVGVGAGVGVGGGVGTGVGAGVGVASAAHWAVNVMLQSLGQSHLKSRLTPALWSLKNSSSCHPRNV